MKRLNIVQRLTTILTFLIVLATAGLVVVVTGIVPISARSGHWEITKWMLNFAKSRSIATHSLGADPPDLKDPLLIVKGAGHYQSGCVQCHGSPATPASPIAKSMTAEPPKLPPIVERRESRELFYVVYNGVKFTGMPAWPAEHRDDEVWAVVAFLRQLPSMDADRYRELVHAGDEATSPATPEAASAAVLATCRRCHGRDGHGQGIGAFPKLAGQNREYLSASLRAFASGERHSGMMQPVATVLAEGELLALADHYAQLPAGLATPRLEQSMPAENAQPRSNQPQGDVARGKHIAENGIPERNVPLCVDCHGPKTGPLHEGYPRLAGQYAPYLELQLKLFRQGSRGGTEASHLMEPVASQLRDQDRRDVAAYYASLDPKGGRSPDD